MLSDDVNGYSECKSLTYLTELHDLRQKRQSFIREDIPEDLDIISNIKKDSISNDKAIYLSRNLLEFSEFDENLRNLYEEDIEKYENWKVQWQKSQNEFGFLNKIELEEKVQNFKNSQIILENRNKEFPQETFEEFKNDENILKFVDENINVEKYEKKDKKEEDEKISNKMKSEIHSDKSKNEEIESL